MKKCSCKESSSSQFTMLDIMRAEEKYSEETSFPDTIFNYQYGAILPFFHFTLEMAIEKKFIVPGMLNECSLPGAMIQSINIGRISFSNAQPAIEDVERDRPTMLQEIVYPRNEITFKNGRTKKKFRSRGGFTVRKLLDCILEFEKEDRPKTEWFGGIDCHHRFFEGLTLNGDMDSYRIQWGSSMGGSVRIKLPSKGAIDVVYTTDVHPNNNEADEQTCIIL